MGRCCRAACRSPATTFLRDCTEDPSCRCSISSLVAGIPRTGSEMESVARADMLPCVAGIGNLIPWIGSGTARSVEMS